MIQKMMKKLDVDNLDIEFERESDHENFVKHSKREGLLDFGDSLSRDGTSPTANAEQSPRITELN